MRTTASPPAAGAAAPAVAPPDELEVLGDESAHRLAGSLTAHAGGGAPAIPLSGQELDRKVVEGRHLLQQQAHLRCVFNHKDPDHRFE